MNLLRLHFFLCFSLKAFSILTRDEGLLALFVVIIFCGNVVVVLFLSIDDDE